MPLIFFIFFCITTSLISKPHQPFTLMLDPAGDTHHAGRTIDGTYERGLTLQLTQALSTLLQEQFPTLRILISRTPGQPSNQQQKSTFANHVADMYVSVCLYQETQQPTVACYYFSCGNNIPTLQKNLRFTPVLEAHAPAASLSQACNQSCYQELKKSYPTLLIHAPVATTLTTLKGITCPAFCLEASLKNSRDIHLVAQRLSAGIAQAVEHCIRSQS